MIPEASDVYMVPTPVSNQNGQMLERNEQDMNAHIFHLIKITNYKATIT
jgi:hypothetical protein